MEFGLNESTIKSIVQAFSENTYGVLSDIKKEYGLGTANFQNGGSWDVRFERIKNAALKHDLVVLKKKRGIWKFYLLLHIETGNLFVFSKEKNLEVVKRNFGKSKIHYFHAFVGLNSEPIELKKYKQTTLFPLIDEEFEEKRIYEAQKILGEDYSSIKSVFFITASEDEGKFVGVEAKKFNPNFDLIDKKDWTSYISTDQYSDLNDVEETVDNNEFFGTIPKVKKEIKDRKDHYKKQIPNEKQKNVDSKEEGK